MSVSDRPHQYKQSSRKGKKAWRKNIDLTDIEKSLEKKNDLEITHGTKDITELADQSLFQIDTQGDEILKSKLIKRKQIKKNLKSSEILDSIKNKSKVDAILHPLHSSADKITKNKRNVQGVSKKELNKLMALAGKRVGESKLKNRIDKEGLVKSDPHDLWNDNDSSSLTTDSSGKKVVSRSGIVVKSPEPMFKDLIDKSTTGWSVATVVPDTLKQKPIQIREFETVPHAGKSYNPSKKEWSDLIENKYNIEKVKQEQRLQMETYRERIKHLMETIDDNEEEDSEDDDEDEEMDESVDQNNEEDLTRLSVNAPTKNKKKTKYQRNKAKRHEEKVKLHQELKKLRKQLHELEKIEEYNKDLEKSMASIGSSIDKIEKKRKHSRNKLGTKYGVLEERLEIKFSDELSDSLRKLRPEGNLLYDNVRKLQSSGKIESRIPITRKKGKKKITEKWTYKDFK